MIIQPTLFDKETENADIEKILLYALGEFQARKKILANRELPLDRLRGAFKRASDKFQCGELNDRETVDFLIKFKRGVGEILVVKKGDFLQVHRLQITGKKMEVKVPEQLSA